MFAHEISGLDRAHAKIIELERALRQAVAAADAEHAAAELARESAARAWHVAGLPVSSTRSTSARDR